MAKKQAVSFKLNGKPVDVLVEPRELLIHSLREKLQHTGPHIGCETSHCGACTVDLNGMSVKSCTVLTVQCQDAEVLTIEGFEQSGALHALQEGFTQETDAVRYCTPAERPHTGCARKPKPSKRKSLLDEGTGAVAGLPEHRQGGAVRGEETFVGERLTHTDSPGDFAMAAATDALEREKKLQGLGTSRLRKEDARFIRGKGTYIDDIKLPGMLHGAIVRSPYAHGASIHQQGQGPRLAGRRASLPPMTSSLFKLD